MEKITYDFQPAVLQNRGDGAWYYRWGIEQVQVEEGTKYKCHEVLVWETLTQDKITEAVIDYLWGGGYEQKLLNDYFAYQHELLPETAEARYLNFLAERKAVKEEIAAVCVEYGIPKSR